MVWEGKKALVPHRPADPSGGSPREKGRGVGAAIACGCGGESRFSGTAHRERSWRGGKPRQTQEVLIDFQCSQGCPREGVFSPLA